MKYLKITEVKKRLNEAGLQVKPLALEELDRKMDDFLGKLIRTVRKGRINPEDVSFLKM